MTRPAVYHCTDIGGRGCHCPYHDWRRPLMRQYAAARREKVLAARRMRSRTCPRKFGRYGVCGAVLESDVVNGRLVVSCPACARFERGVCCDCPRPVAGQPRKSRRCAAHTKAAQREQTERHRELYHAKVNRDSKLRMRQPHVRARNDVLKRVWRERNPEKVRAQKIRTALREYRAMRGAA